MSKDLFSQNASDYRDYRPSYPPELFAYLASLCSSHQRAWDCACGNGQAAVLMAPHFEQVEASDMSNGQLEKAILSSNIHYSVQLAEKTSFPAKHFDLCVVAQALHWFDFEAFYAELNRVMKPGATVAFIAYSLMKTGNSGVDDLIFNLYSEILGPYWDPERKHIDEAYDSIPFPFEAIKTPAFEMKQEWNAGQVIAYLSTWSALGHFRRQNNHDPLNDFAKSLQTVWGEKQILTINFPLVLKIGRIPT